MCIVEDTVNVGIIFCSKKNKIFLIHFISLVKFLCYFCTKNMKSILNHDFLRTFNSTYVPKSLILLQYVCKIRIALVHDAKKNCVQKICILKIYFLEKK